MLDLQPELQLRFDRTAIAYRKWLKDLGVTFGGGASVGPEDGADWC
jgi:hypothetical protein